MKHSSLVAGVQGRSPWWGLRGNAPRSLFLRRCYDVCALTDKDVTVTVNGEKLSVKTFDKYVDLYLGDDAADRKRAYEVVTTTVGPWEVAATYTDTGVFEQVSFVNGVSTLRGGKHVEYLSSAIVGKLQDLLTKKKKETGGDVKTSLIKNHLFLFVKALVPNPTFDGQSKETLTTPASRFGTGKIELSEKFYSTLAKSGIMERVAELSSASQLKDLKKLDGKVSSRITGIVKLDDANWAGGAKRKDCTLILTEGDSAKSMALAGISVRGRRPRTPTRAAPWTPALICLFFMHTLKHLLHQENSFFAGRREELLRRLSSPRQSHECQRGDSRVGRKTTNQQTTNS